MKEALRDIVRERFPAHATHTKFASLPNWLRLSQLAPMVALANTIRTYLDGIVRAMADQRSNGFAESLNSQIQAARARAKDYKNAGKLYLHLSVGGTANASPSLPLAREQRAGGERRCVKLTHWWLTGGYFCTRRRTVPSNALQFATIGYFKQCATNEIGDAARAAFLGDHTSAGAVVLWHETFQKLQNGFANSTYSQRGNFIVTTTEPEKLCELDGIRGIAIALVLGFHYFFDFFDVVPGSFFAYVLTPIRVMWSGVDLFFILSGFLICRILISRRFSGNYFLVFYGRRACRILPLYFLMLALFCIGINLQSNAIIDIPKLFGSAERSWTYLFFLQNFEIALFGGQINFLSVSWSLAVEEQLYLFLPLLVFAFRHRIERLRLGFLVLVGFAIVCRLIIGFFSTNADVICYVLPFTRADAFAVGGLLAYRFDRERTNTATHNRAAWMVLFISAIGLAVVAHGPHLGQQKYIPIIAFYGAFIFLSLSLPALHWLRFTLRAKSLAWLGKSSFSIYLLHMPVLGMTLWANDMAGAELVGVKPQWITLTALLITLALAQVSRIYFEEKIVRWGRTRWQYREA